MLLNKFRIQKSYENLFIRKKFYKRSRYCSALVTLQILQTEIFYTNFKIKQMNIHNERRETLIQDYRYFVCHRQH